MINYRDAIKWCIQNDAVFRFTERRARSEFIIMNEATPGDKSLELAVTVDGRTIAVHCPLDASKEPSSAVASSLTAGVEFFIAKFKQRALHFREFELR